ncbi:hypothetical protein TSUD_165510 [Trifolium subterraneum]|uniref:Uncharacterized protein n=1 Tax=Trifolium subterraneum TaxID=3900 RepID=A0A2Z6MGR6_TRISU|nr:hypothetical protein TSUD_165510 [Trifolium subterraneum]
MALASSWNMNIGALGSSQKTMLFEVSCSNRKRDRDRERGSNNKSIHPPYKVVEITPPPKSLGVRCLPPNDMQLCRDLVGTVNITIEQPFGTSTPTILMASAALLTLSTGPANFLANNESESGL